MNFKIEYFIKSLLEDYSDKNRKTWSAYFIKNPGDLRFSKEILLVDKYISSRFSWILGDISDSNPEILFPHIQDLYDIRNKIKFDNFSRSLAKFAFKCGIPEKNKNKIISLLFEWIMSPNEIVSTKYYSVQALFKISSDYPEIKNELVYVIKDQYNKNSISFKKLSDKILNQLGR